MSTTSGGSGKERGYTWLVVLLVAALAFAVVDFFLLNQKTGQDRQAVGLTTQVQVLSQQTAKFALESAGGNIESFKELSSTRNTIDAAVSHLTEGDADTRMPP